jgi:hypothetical protein
MARATQTGRCVDGRARRRRWAADRLVAWPPRIRQDVDAGYPRVGDYTPDLGPSRPRESAEDRRDRQPQYGWPVHVIENCADDPPRDQPRAFLDALRVALGTERSPWVIANRRPL